VRDSTARRDAERYIPDYLLRHYPTKRTMRDVLSGVWVTRESTVLALKHSPIQLRCAAAHLTASRLPLAASTPNHITNDVAVHIPNKNPCQLSCVLSMIAWATYGPTMDDARLEDQTGQRTAHAPVKTGSGRRSQTTYHVIEPRCTELGHQCIIVYEKV
jgi:hypothetical protein